MATAKGDVDIAVKLRGAREFAADTRRVSGSIKGIDDQTDRTSSTLQRLSGRTGGLSSAMKTLGPMAAAAGGALLTFGAIEAKKALDTTNDLFKSTVALRRATEMSSEEASTFAAVAKVRGIGDRQMSMAMKSLAGQMVGYTDGVDSAREALDFFGVSQQAIKSRDFMSVLDQIAAGYDKSGDAAKRTTYMSKLFGRAWRDLSPLFAQGAKAFREEMDLAGGLGSAFSDQDIKNWGQFREAQRSAQYASLGLQVALGKKLVPMLAKAALGVTKFISNWSKNKGTAGDIKKVFEDVGPVIGKAFKFLWKAGGALVRIWKQSKTVRTSIKQAFQALPIASAISTVVKLIGVFKGLKRGVNAVKRAFVDVWGAIKSTGRDAINFIIRGWNSLQFKIPAFDPPGPGPKFGGTTIGVPRIPELADGGRIRRSGMAWVGERGPELVRLPRGAQVEPLPAGAGFGGTVVTKVYLDRRQIAEAVGAEFAGRQARR